MKLTRKGCRARQQYLLQVLEDKGLDGAIISRREHVYYFTGFLHQRFHAAAVFIEANGQATLAGAGDVEEAAVDHVVPYQADFYSTMHSRHYEAVAEYLAPSIPQNVRLGADLGGGAACISNLGAAEDLTREVYRLRKCKLPDEVDAIRAAIGITEAMYAAAKEAIHPGVNEVEVLAQLRAAATLAASEDLEYMGNDFRANDMGGLARRRRMEAGELYILDAGAVLHGYYADNCRTFAVDRSPSETQMKAQEHIDALFPQLEAAVAPGVKGQELFQLANQYLGQDGYSGLVHHLGHGIGLAPHETPELNPEYDAVFEVGDVFTMEPGLYAEELKAGIRLEENYALTENGLEKLTSFPRSLI